MSLDVFECWHKEEAKCMKCGDPVADTDIWFCALTEAFEIDDTTIALAKCDWDDSVNEGDVGINADYRQSMLICVDCLQGFLGYVALKK